MADRYTELYTRMRRDFFRVGGGGRHARSSPGVPAGTESCELPRLDRAGLRFILFYHSLLSDWNHGNAHFLRGIASELLSRGHEVTVFEPRLAWSLQNLVARHGESPIHRFQRAYPDLSTIRYELDELDLERVLAGADVVIAHEWNHPELVRRLGAHRERTGARYALLFHDTHHRSVTRPEEMDHYELGSYDGVLAYGEVIRRIYLGRGWVRRAWTWHEAADTRRFRPLPTEPDGDLVWIGNWGDDERTTEIRDYLLRPVRDLKLRARVFGVRFPEHGVRAVRRSGASYEGWLPNYRVPQMFARHRVTVHIPRRPYVESLPGIPTIRPFEALACGIPLVCSAWNDAEGLFAPGRDFLVAWSPAEMLQHLRTLLNDRVLSRELSEHGRHTVLERHTCAHRVDELLEICRSLGVKERQLSRVSAGLDESAAVQQV
jgi:spore maturation protein CgeB